MDTKTIIVTLVTDRTQADVEPGAGAGGEGVRGHDRSRAGGMADRDEGRVQRR